MAQKERSRTKFFIFLCCIIVVSCAKNEKNRVDKTFETVDISQVPNTTVFQNDTALNLQNGVYYFGNKPYSGFIKEVYPNNAIKSVGSYLQGKQHGTTKTFYENGQLRANRNYKNGFSYGKHFGFWENGNKKFDFVYLNDKREGVQKQWYKSGQPYCELTFKNDREDGMQKAWRENGKAYINYEVKEGIRYGLQKSALCYTLKNQKIK